MTGVDTNVLVRYFVEDDRAQFEAARALLEDEVAVTPLRVNLVVLAELAWVLETCYSVTRDELTRVIDELLTDPRIDLQDRAAVAVASHEFSSSGEFADLLIAADNTLHGCARTMTFDRNATRIAGMELLA